MRGAFLLRRSALAAAALLAAAGVNAEPRGAVLLAQAAASTAPSASTAPVPPASPLAPAPVSAAPAAVATASPVLTLSDAYRLALENDQQLAVSQSATESRRERVPQARAQLLPNLSANATRFKNQLESTTPNPLTGAPVTTQRDYFSSSKALVLRQPLFRPVQFADLRQAKAQVADAEAQLAKAVQDVASRVTQAYLEALLAEEQVALIRAQEKANSTQLEAARRGLSAGTGTRTDIDEAQARLDLSVAQELAARQNVDYTRRQLQMLINQPVGALARLDPARLPLVSPVPDNLQSWVERAEQASPEIVSALAQLEAARQEVEKARAQHLPTVDAIAQISRSENDSINNLNTRYDNKQIGFQLNVPLFSGGYVNSLVRQALAEQERVEHALEGLRRDLALRVEKEFRGVTEGVPQVRALEQAVRSADTAAESARRSYRAGSRTLVDVLNADQQAVQARRDLAQARFMYMASRVRLIALTGDADQAAIDQVNSWLAP